MAKRKPAIVTIKPKQEPKPVPIPEHLDPGKMKSLTPGKVTAYQKKVFAHFAPWMEIPFFQTMVRLLSSGDADALELYAKITKKIEAKAPAISVSNNFKSNSDNDNRSIQAHGVMSMDAICRKLQAGRAAAALAGPAPTPVREGGDTGGDDEE